MDDLDRKIRYFLKIAELSSLSRAAADLDMTQSGLSRQLAALESYLGKPLFVRTGRGMRLTDAGKRLQLEARIRYEQIDTAVRLVRERVGITEGDLHIATIHTLGSYFVSDILAEFIRQRGRINLFVMARGSPNVVELVEKGKADVGFVYDSAVASDVLDSAPLFDDNMCVIMRRDDFHGEPSINLCVSQFPLIGFPENYALRNMLKRANMDARVVAEANTVDAMLRLVSSGIGNCILPDRIPSQLLAEYRLVKVPLSFPTMRRRAVAIIRSDVRMPSMARELFHMAAAASMI